MLLNIFSAKHFSATLALAFPVPATELRYSVRSVITELSATPRHEFPTVDKQSSGFQSILILQLIIAHTERAWCQQ